SARSSTYSASRSAVTVSPSRTAISPSCSISHDSFGFFDCVDSVSLSLLCSIVSIPSCFRAKFCIREVKPIDLDPRFLIAESLAPNDLKGLGFADTKFLRIRGYGLRDHHEIPGCGKT